MGKERVILHPRIDTFGGIFNGEKMVGLTIIENPDEENESIIGLPIPLEEAIDIGKELIRLAYATMYNNDTGEENYCEERKRGECPFYAS